MQLTANHASLKSRQTVNSIAVGCWIFVLLAGAQLLPTTVSAESNQSTEANQSKLVRIEGPRHGPGNCRNPAAF